MQPGLGALIAFLVGLLAGYWWGRRAAGRAAPAPPAGSSSGRIPRPALPAASPAPLYAPRAAGTAAPAGPPPSPLEETLDGAHRPMDTPVPMPGLAAAARLGKDHGARAWLHVIAGPAKGQSILLGDTRVAFGRAPENTVVLRGDLVSNHHAELVPHAGGYYVRDLGSRNGTFVNDVRVPEVRLNAGDVVSIGETKLFFQG